ncbi:hypothetical protein NDU88_006039 [Pleurodeles waltl]|uniref:Uncharacterized protein n=1 Tax=Pleurodeles waltl TaxID=8319 RepID=A0AAV7LR98_PLEWA|nr:hypothetical protein NDU88_006039 [Pleurodeles waltl]
MQLVRAMGTDQARVVNVQSTNEGLPPTGATTSSGMAVPGCTVQQSPRHRPGRADSALPSHIPVLGGGVTSDDRHRQHCATCRPRASGSSEAPVASGPPRHVGQRVQATTSAATMTTQNAAAVAHPPHPHPLLLTVLSLQQLLVCSDCQSPWFNGTRRRNFTTALSF